MKKIFYILAFFFSLQSVAHAQDDQAGDIREKMTKYIQDKLGLSRAETEKFVPLFMDYFRDLRKTNQEFRNDRLVLQQKIVELRLRYRDQFKPVIGDKRSNDVFIYEREFVNKVKEIREERLQNRQDGRSNKRNQLPEL